MSEALSSQAVQLKGASSMWLNRETSGYAESLEALVWMREHWKLSVIRAAVGIEPQGAYLDNPVKAKAQLERIVENAVAAGVYVIIETGDWNDSHLQRHGPFVRDRMRE